MAFSLFKKKNMAKPPQKRVPRGESAAEGKEIFGLSNEESFKEQMLQPPPSPPQFFPSFSADASHQEMFQQQIPVPPMSSFTNKQSLAEQKEFDQGIIPNLEPAGQPAHSELPEKFEAVEKPDIEGFSLGAAEAPLEREVDVSRPIFVKLEKYRLILKELNNIKALAASANNSVTALISLKRTEDSELEEWRSRLEDVERKIVYIDEMLFGST